MGVNVDVFADIEIFRKVIKCLLADDSPVEMVLDYREARGMLRILRGDDALCRCEDFYRKTLKGGLKNE